MSHGLWLASTDVLADWVWFVGDPQVGKVFADFLCHLLGGEADGGDVVGAQVELTFRCLHELDSGPVAVGDVHHGQAGLGAQVALVVSGIESVMENLDRIV